MDYKAIATKIVKNAVGYIEANSDQKFGAARVGLISIGVLTQEAINSRDTDAPNWNRILLEEIEKAALQ